MKTDPERIARRLDALAAIGRTGDGVTRLGLTIEEQAARDLVASWLAPYGARIRRDAAGNLFCRIDGDGAPVLVGSHLDSVPNGGRFDGALGVVCAVEAVEALLADGTRPRRAVEVVAWADEEGARFGIGTYGSAAAFGRLPADAATRRDRDGTSVSDALRALGERGDPTAARLDPGDIPAYLELHIEQGPRLASEERPIAVVSDIVGIVQGRIELTGRADHAGTTPIADRHDALLGGAEVALALERRARGSPTAIGTVGQIEVAPGARNVVPGRCTLSFDVRATTKPDLDALVGALRSDADGIAGVRRVRCDVDVLAAKPPVSLDADIQRLLRRCAQAAGVGAPSLSSGAGHDASNAQLAGVRSGMVFVRSTGGSHTPSEHASAEDAAIGAHVLALALRDLAS